MAYKETVWCLLHENALTIPRTTYVQLAACILHVLKNGEFVLQDFVVVLRKQAIGFYGKSFIGIHSFTLSDVDQYSFIFHLLIQLFIGMQNYIVFL